ncbi:unnamed protein product [Schistocephalus solidus]|uniref:USP domain-containing protein n=1 Tax=Schistocephalus solidus TaxID=70667 RepID=A0A3P7C6V8_SCHSO|nr:unnamed protein product [Schistocephalus solidus]
MTFRGWELRLPLCIYASNGQPIVISKLPLSSDNFSAPFSLCLSDVAQQYQQNPILVMHSNATLGAVRDRAAIMASACVYARRTPATDSSGSPSTLQMDNPALLPFTYGSERLSLGPAGVGGAPRRPQHSTEAVTFSGGSGTGGVQLPATASTLPAETPLGHNFDWKPIGEIGFQTGRPLIIRLQLTEPGVKEPCTTSGTSSAGSSVCNLDSLVTACNGSRSAVDVPTSAASPRRSSGSSSRLGASLSFSQRFSSSSSTAPHPPPPQKVSSANPALGGASQANFAATQPSDNLLPLKPLALPSIALGSGASVYDLLFELAEADLHELTVAAHEVGRCGAGSGGGSGGGGSSDEEPRQPSLLHLTRLLLYCLPTYNPATQTGSSTRMCAHTTGLLPSSTTASGNDKFSTTSAMVCTPETVVKAPQFRLLYMLQVLSSELVTRETSAWWESVQTVAGATSVTSGDLGGHADASNGLLNQPELLDLQRHPGEIPKRSSFAFIESTAVGERVRPKLLISSESCLSMPTTLTGELGPTSAPTSPGVERKRHHLSIGKFSLRWPGPGSTFSGKSKQPHELMSVSAPVQSSDWLEPLVIVLRKQLAFMPSLTPSNLTGLVMPGLFPFSGPESSTRDSRCADWICREIKHLCLQIMATLLNPSPKRLTDSTLADSRSSSVSSVCSTLAMASGGFAAKFVSVVLDTALASADITDSGRSDRVSTARGNLNGGGGGGVSSGRRRGPKLLHVESNAGVANVLDPLAVTDVALTCQDVEIAVQSIRLLCQSVLSYPSYFMDAFMQLPQLGQSLLRLLLHSPAVRIRAETCHQLEQLFQLEAFQQQYNFPASSATWAPVQHRNSAFGVETCCYLFQRDGAKSPMFLSQISREEAQASALLDALFTILFKPTSTLPPFWNTQLAHLSDADRRFMLQCSEFFRLRGRLAALAEHSCLQHYAGVDTVGLFENEIQWFRVFASANAAAPSWDEKIYPSAENALLCGHLRFLRTACYQLVSSLLLRSNSTGSEMGLAAGGPPFVSTSSSNGFYMGEPTDYCRTCPRPSTCQGLFPPSNLLPLLRSKNMDLCVQTPEDPRFAFDLRGRSGAGTTMDPSLLLTARCLRSLRDLVPHLLLEYLFSAAFCMLDMSTAGLGGADATATSTTTPELLVNFTSALAHFAHSQGVGEQQTSVGSRLAALLRPPSRKLSGRARREAFLLLLFLCRMDLACLQSTVEILVRLHHSRYSHTAAVDATGSSTGQQRSLFSLSSTIDLRRPTSPGGSFLDGAGPLQVAPAQLFTATAVVWDVMPVLSGRAVCNFTGLRNGGATCYMNSILQQLFMQPGLFLNLMYSQLQFYDPASFWQSFRMWGTDNPIDPREQQDAFDFFQALTDQLDENLKKLNEEPLFSKVFHGTLSDSMFCEDCGHRYDREQSFSAINIPTSAGDLVEALKQYVQEEVLDGENAYFCERCQLKQRTLKRLTFSSLPPVLCLQLKRFGFDWDRQMSVKYNQYFSFPRKLDMSPFSGDPVSVSKLAFSLF